MKLNTPAPNRTPAPPDTLVGTAHAGLWTEVNPADKPSTAGEESILSLPATPAAIDPVDSADEEESVTTSHGVELGKLPDLEEELNRDNKALIREADRSFDKAPDSTPLMLVNQADPYLLLNNRNFPFQNRCKLIWFLKKMKASTWMRLTDEGLYAQRISLGLCGSWASGAAMALCGLQNRFCQLPDYCPRCCLRLRAKPAVREYRKSFAKAPNWYMLTPSYECDPEQAGLHFVLQKGDAKRGIKAKLRHYRPFAGRDFGSPPPLTPDDVVGNVNSITDCFEAIFDLARVLVRCNVAQGLLAHREIAWSFELNPVGCWLTPNGTIIINSEAHLDFPLAVEVYNTFLRLYQARPFGHRLYADLHCEQILSQKELNRCIYYALKPMKYVPGYLRAAEAGADMEMLNLVASDRVFQGGNVVLGQQRSPRRMGNMRCNGTDYIGSGSVTADRKEQTRLKREGNGAGQHQPPTTGSTDLEKAIGSETLRRREGLD